ncbi:MAG: hypothetical protein ACYS47_11905 [Planctomycetota bacterium]|jgi:hypothetical protein
MSLESSFGRIVPALLILSLPFLFLAGCSKSTEGSGDPTLEEVLTDMPDVWVVVSTPSSPQSGDVTIQYSLIDERGTPVDADIQVFYSVTLGVYIPATRGTGGESTTGLSAAPAPGVAHTYVWDSQADLGQSVSTVVIRIRRVDTGTTMWAAEDETGGFQLMNARAAVTTPAKVYDPKLPGAGALNVTYRIDPAGVSPTATVQIVDAVSSVEVRRLVNGQVVAGGTDLAAPWDGRDNGGRFVDTGDYKAVVTASILGLPVAPAEVTLHVVRLGVTGIQFQDNGAGNEEYPMMYHIRNTSKYTYYAIPDNRAEWALGANLGEVADLDVNSGLPRTAPAVWANLNSPPQDGSDPAGVEDDTYNLPACYKRGALPRIRVSLGAGSVSHVTPGAARGCNYPVTGLPIRIVSSGATPVAAGSNEGVSPGNAIDFTANTALPFEVKKNSVNFTFAFEYQDGAAWVPIPGAVQTAHTAYTIFDAPALTTSPSPSPPYLPWVRVVDIVCGWVNGPATANGICSTVTNQVNVFFGLQYDTSIGACHYTTGQLNGHVMQMSDFIEDWDQSTFTTVNCSDCACLTATFANTVGVNHRYLILGWSTGSIPLHYQIPIGRTWMVPFSGAFSYHAVATRDGALTISDACCTLDNDGNPANPPHIALLPVELPYATYNALLSSNPGNYGNYALVRCGQQ